MVLICHPHKFIYLKTHKTASTSVELALEPLCAPPGHVVRRERRNMLETEFGIVGARAPGRDTVRARPDNFYFHHMGATRVLSFLGQEKFESYRKVACVRNPFKRLLSQFFFLPKWHKTFEPPVDLDDARAKFRTFLMSEPNDKPNKFRAKTDRYLVHVDGKFILDDILRVEKLSDDLETFLTRVGLANSNVSLTRERNNEDAQRNWSVMDFFDDAENVDRALRIDDWVFRAANYSTDPRDA